ncbi:DUF4810 domain-containing protein [Sulfurimonas sp. C5]|uniref:DUF4810 domain-containing protein n=1 Tax=Sulfurimonas sp. C5 TaxID=3036947 RepID=UPI002457DCD7|nr:DUF4810 domain-containing protein [Sulfurimonas sp. C5]MDH4944812.1 DUF4810 domain-containing protein [Sulfurimonas sp. C5]
MISIKTFFLIAGIVLLTGCASQPTALYNYDGYSESYYAYKKEPSKESLEKLIEVIEGDISNTDESISKRVPPGLYAELGYLYLKSNNKEKAITFFEKEKALYPESRKFMNALIRKVEVSEGGTK